MKPKVLILTLLLLIIFIGANSIQVYATTVIKMDFDSIVKSADVIISGKVVEIEAKREINPTTSKYSIYTHVTIELDDKLKGDIKDNFYTIRILGGVIPGEEIGEAMAGAPKFKKGQEVFLFLKNDKTLYSPVIGFSQGRFNIKTDPKTGMKKVYDNMGKPVTEKFLTGDNSKDATRAVGLDFFKSLVRKKMK